MRAAIFWFTGLSGAGKSTVAEAVATRLQEAGCKVLILDGDYVRTHLHTDLGFSCADIKKNNALIVDLCRKHRPEFDVIFVPIISPYQESRQKAREALASDFYEIYFSATLDTVMRRDVKGLYAKAKRNEITDMIGLAPQAVYEAPLHPDHVIDSAVEDVQASARCFEEFVLTCIRRGSC